MTGKGSRPRPFSVAQEEYDKRWDAIFGRDLEEQTEQQDDQRQEHTEQDQEPRVV